MKRELKQLVVTDDCCPGHDAWPNDTYKSRRSKKARSRGKKLEHKLVRTIHKRNLREELTSLQDSV